MGRGRRIVPPIAKHREDAGSRKRTACQRSGQSRHADSAGGLLQRKRGAARESGGGSEEGHLCFGRFEEAGGRQRRTMAGAKRDSERIGAERAGTNQYSEKR